MKMIYHVKCKKYRTFKNPEILYFFYKTFINSIIGGKCSSKHKRILKEEELIEILKIIVLIENK